ncbi:MAG: hypothetical protein RLZZ188_1158 [Verrucomicrobiota bacterium]|jgi:glycosyltransferase involved in cell wall biosynthesis
MNAPGFTIVIPAFNRPEPLKFTLSSVAKAIHQLPVAAEILLIDDGSETPLSVTLEDFSIGQRVEYIRQANQGSIIARLTGLRHARGQCVLFLDSDDLIDPRKLSAHWSIFSATDADVVYDDMALANLGPEYSSCFSPGPELRETDSLVDLLLQIQPAPHGPSYRREWLMSALREPMVPPQRQLDPSGDVWLFYNLLLQPACVRKVSLPLTAGGPHEQERYSAHWEKLGVAALRIAEEFMRRCPMTNSTTEARRVVGECAFNAWRRLPRDFDGGYTRRLLSIWRSAPPSRLHRLGGTVFLRLARIGGPLLASRILRLRNHSYASCRTLNERQLAALLLH